MDELRKKIIDMKKLDNILKEINSKGISRQVSKDTRFMNDVKKSMEGLNDDVYEVRNSILEAFELLEDAKIRDQRGVDPRYIKLLKGRGLDPSSERKMREIRSSYLILDNTLREANMALDEKWEKEHRRDRSLETPSLDFIYQTLRSNRSIAKNQLHQLEAISNHVKNRSLYNHGWRRGGDIFVRESENVAPLSERLRKQKLHSSMSTSARVPARKQTELRNLLSKRTSVPVRRTTLVSDWRTRSSSLNESLATYSETLDGDSDKEEKENIVEEKTSGKGVQGKGNLSTFQKERPLAYEADMKTQSRIPSNNGKNEMSSSATWNEKLSMTTKDPIKTKPFPAEAPSLENTPASIAKGRTERPFTSTPVPSSAKVNAANHVDKPGSTVPPREAAAAAALARAGMSQAGRLDSGAAIPAKTMVEHKAKDPKIVSARKDANAEEQAHLIADAAVKDAENKMKNVTQTPPSNTGTTFTVRSSTSATQSSGPPVMVVQPGGGGFAVNKPSNSKDLPTSQRPIAFSSTKAPFSFQPNESQIGISLTGRPFPAAMQAPSRTVGTDHETPATGSVGENVGGTLGVKVGIHTAGNVTLSDGVGGQDLVSKTMKTAPTSRSSSTMPVSSDRGLGTVARNLFDQVSTQDQGSIVDVRGEPEGESKQPVMIQTTGQRQAAVGKSDKDSSQPGGVPLGSAKQPYPKTTSLAVTATISSQPLTSKFPSTLIATSPFVFGGGNVPADFSGFGTLSKSASASSTPPPAPSTTTTISQSSSSSQSAGSTGSDIPERASTAPASSQPTPRLEALGSREPTTQAPFTGFQAVVSSSPLAQTLPTASMPHVSTPPKQADPAPLSAPSPVARAPQQESVMPPSVSPTVTSLAPAQHIPSKSTVSSETPLKSLTQEETTGTTLANSSTQGVGLTSSFPAVPPSFRAESNLVNAAAIVNSTASPLASFQTAQTTTVAQPTSFQSTLPSSPFSGALQTTGFSFGQDSKPTETKPNSAFGGGLSGLGGKPQDPNRNPFAVSPSSQTSDLNLFGTSGSNSNPSSFQSATPKPAFGSVSPASAPSFGGAPTFGGSPVFGGAPTFGGSPSFGAPPTFGRSPTFGGAATFGGAPTFGGSPTFGGTAAFGSGVGATGFAAGSSVFGNMGNSPGRIFGSGTETSAMFSSSETPTFGSLSGQSSVPSFGALAGGQTGDSLGGSTGFNPSISSSSFSSYR